MKKAAQTLLFAALAALLVAACGGDAIVDSHPGPTPTSAPSAQ